MRCMPAVRETATAERGFVECSCVRETPGTKKCSQR